jgi:hypothetical protein
MQCPHCGEEIVVKWSPQGAEHAVAYYYHANAASKRRITLRSIAEKFGYNYSYLSNVKSAYDRAGKWGAKNKATP